MNEGYRNRCLNKFLKFSRKNFYMVFGTKKLYWFLPFKTPEEY